MVVLILSLPSMESSVSVLVFYVRNSFFMDALPLFLEHFIRYYSKGKSASGRINVT